MFRITVAAALALAACGTSTTANPSDGGITADGGAPHACALGTLPTTYEAASFEANTVVERDIITRFNTFQQPMKDAEANLAIVPTEAALQALFTAGAPSLKSLTTTYYAARVDALITAFVAAAGKDWTPAEPVPAAGGKYGNWLFTPRGLDIRQGIEKGMFAATFYNHALTLMGGAVTAATVDRILALFGAHPSFPNDSGAATHPDRLIAQYAERRDKKDAQSPGYYVQMKSAFITARAAAALPDCTAQRDAAFATIRGLAERVLFSTVIFYLNDAGAKLGKASPTPAELASGLHSYGETEAFVHGWRMLPQASRTITDVQLDEILALIGAPVTGDVTSYKLVTSGATELPKLTQAITRIAQIYGFSAQQIEDFKVAN